jgi:phosphatidylethanolamine/phosphatidyl-N-methylethanolamine N-methyltransferase
MDIDAIRKAYRRYARRYDFYFGALLEPGRRAVVTHMHCRAGQRILEVGVGTGLSLPLYPADVQVTGIDISPEMLLRARARRERQRLGQVVALEQMDAEHMRFADDSFDKVVAMYVASVVPTPARLVDEMKRVCRPGGALYVVNHFHRGGSLVGRIERRIAPLSRLMGFRPDLSCADFIRDSRLDVIEQIPVNLFGYWTLLCARNDKPAAGAAVAGMTARPYDGGR